MAQASSRQGLQGMMLVPFVSGRVNGNSGPQWGPLFWRGGNKLFGAGKSCLGRHFLPRQLIDGWQWRRPSGTACGNISLHFIWLIVGEIKPSTHTINLPWYHISTEAIAASLKRTIRVVTEF